MLKRRGADAGIADLHPHAFRHTWAHAFRAAGGNEGDLMLLGGWRSRAMLDRYGKTAAADRGVRALPAPVGGARLRAVGGDRQADRPLARRDRAE
jgi:integrase